MREFIDCKTCGERLEHDLRTGQLDDCPNCVMSPTAIEIVEESMSFPTTAWLDYPQPKLAAERGRLKLLRILMYLRRVEK